MVLMNQSKPQWTCCLFIGIDVVVDDDVDDINSDCSFTNL